MKIIVAITGATGTIYAIRLLELLKKLTIETHLIMSKWAIETLHTETNYSVDYLEGLATEVYDNGNLAAAISSGSFKTDGMVIAPCSMKTLAAISHGFSENLIQRTADVAIKENRKLILVPRETPLNPIHLENMLKLSRMGIVIMPPMPGFYNQPQSLDDIVNFHAGRILDQLGIEHNFIKRWH
ncbi:UbiX family flavin prenyltransferase [Sporomusa acidovorans]|uniref:Flavin prenyltransferase UbiX n=1 Tax=Sporomusa acidovorans (strain ATCC 49682 / DSM 3132 / Mol) TaxID=1123286 RepID=A0ABZ3J7S1_SPOA4|nr:UbiX family flavin prenyltransferase [Sporomusa acidovorans]OZC16709.1 putative aromatic acid decarboxylase [Sporomusa acidovorans DSM 3132]SDE05101.1 4-hydroxy-3-polyprenylbenzoate decarboxylase [Sporomusa acidovorans]